MSTNSTNAEDWRPAFFWPGTLIISGARVAVSKLVCLHHIPWSPRCHPWSPQRITIVLLRSRELFVIASIFFAMGTAWGASQLGLSLALGAFFKALQGAQAALLVLDLSEH